LLRKKSSNPAPTPVTPHSHPNNKKSACDDERVKKLTDENLKLKKKIETIEEAAEEKRTDQEC
jgi:hypothetical protein